MLLFPVHRACKLELRFRSVLGESMYRQLGAGGDCTRPVIATSNACDAPEQALASKWTLVHISTLHRLWRHLANNSYTLGPNTLGHRRYDSLSAELAVCLALARLFAYISVFQRDALSTLPGDSFPLRGGNQQNTSFRCIEARAMPRDTLPTNRIASFPLRVLLTRTTTTSECRTWDRAARVRFLNLTVSPFRFCSHHTFFNDDVSSLRSCVDS